MKIGTGCVLGLALFATMLLGCQTKVAGPIEVEAPKGAEEAKAVIGKNGGWLKFVDGVKLEIPSNLLLEQVPLQIKQHKTTFDLEGKDAIGQAYQIKPSMSFAPGLARLYIPLDKALAGDPMNSGVKLYTYGKTEATELKPSVDAWMPYRASRFTGLSSDRKYLVFDLQETSGESARPPFGLLQAGYDLH